MLDTLGLGSALDRVSIRPEAIRIGDGRSGRTIAEVPLGAAAERRYGAPYRVLHRADLQAVLLEAVRRAPPIELRLGQTVVEVGDGPSVAVKGDPPSGSVEAGRLIVGADGVRSAVRGALPCGAPLPAPRFIAWRTLVDAPGLSEDALRPSTRIWLAPTAHLVAYPMANRVKVNLVLVTDAPAGEAPPRSVLSGFGGPAARLLAAAERWNAWPLFDVPPAAKFGAGPVTLVGDAAHPVLPFLAQGAALAIEDAAVLAHRLASTLDAAAAARAYEADRAPRWRDVQRAAAANGRLYHLGGISAVIRNAALRAAPSQRLLARYDWLFGWCPPG